VFAFNSFVVSISVAMFMIGETGVAKQGEFRWYFIILGLFVMGSLCLLYKFKNGNKKDRDEKGVNTPLNMDEVEEGRSDIHLKA